MESAKSIQTVYEPEDQEEVLLEQPKILEEIAIEELSVDGICGVY